MKTSTTLRLTSEPGVATRETTAAQGTAPPPLAATDVPAAPPSPSATVVGVSRGEGVVAPTLPTAIASTSVVPGGRCTHDGGGPSSAGVVVGVAVVSAAKSLSFIVAR